MRFKLLIIETIVIFIVNSIFQNLNSTLNSCFINIDVTGKDFLTLKGDSVNLKQLLKGEETNIVIIFNLPVCHDCLVKLNDYFGELINKNVNINLISVITTYNSIISRRQDKNYFKKYFSNKTEIIFYNNINIKKDTDIFFKSNSPSIIMINDVEQVYLSNELLFENNYFNYKLIEKYLKKN